jgi:hypothetical protein
MLKLLRISTFSHPLTIQQLISSVSDLLPQSPQPKPPPQWPSPHSRTSRRPTCETRRRGRRGVMVDPTPQHTQLGNTTGSRAGKWRRRVGTRLCGARLEGAKPIWQPAARSDRLPRFDGAGGRASVLPTVIIFFTFFLSSTVFFISYAHNSSYRKNYANNLLYT